MLYRSFAEAHIGGNRSWTDYEYYKKIRPQVEEKMISEKPNLLLSEYNDNPLKYYIDNITNTEFLGRTIKTHKNYKPILEKIEITMGKPNGVDYRKYKNSSEYTINGFSIRFQNDVDKISNHSFGMAIDVDATYNPQLYKEALAFVSILTNYNFIWQKSSTALTVEKMKSASASLKNVNITAERLDQMTSGLLAIDQYKQLKNVYFFSDLTTGTLINEFNQYAKEFGDIYQRSAYLSNERHFYENPTLYTKTEVLEAEKELYETIPKNCQDIGKKLTKFEKKIIPLHNLFKNHYKYAFFLNENLGEEYRYIEEYLGGLISQTQNMRKILSSLEQLADNHTIPSCFSCEMGDIERWVVYDELLVTDLLAFLSWVDSNNRNIYKTEKYNDFASWVAKNQQGLLGLCKRGFFRIDNEFVHYFLDHKEIEWGGFFKNRNDWMHFEIKRRYSEF
jgi:hypothetical protein